jgi:hypothetical protein
VSTSYTRTPIVVDPLALQDDGTDPDFFPHIEVPVLLFFPLSAPVARPVDLGASFSADLVTLTLGAPTGVGNFELTVHVRATDSATPPHVVEQSLELQFETVHIDFPVATYSFRGYQVDVLNAPDYLHDLQLCLRALVDSTQNIHNRQLPLPVIGPGDPIAAFTEELRELVAQVAMICTDEAIERLASLQYVTGRSIHSSPCAAVLAAHSSDRLTTGIKAAGQQQQE